jgi:hypothetical protein
MKTSLSCPSYIAKSGAELFGIINSEGQVHYLSESIVIDDDFVDEANKGRKPEERFRFAGKCIEKGCKQWETNTNMCGLTQKIIRTINNIDTLKELPNCAIRDKCRWFAQENELACANCSEVFRNQEGRNF